MIRKMLTITALLAALTVTAQESFPPTPDIIYGELFRDVQEARIFPDGKTFVDCVPKREPAEIVKEYLSIKNNPAIKFALEIFVEQNFQLPAASGAGYVTNTAEDISTHIRGLWKQLRREADKPVKGSSLLPLPHPYIVPGGRFREIYYWDSYFTMLGLKESGEFEMIGNMVRNFAYLIDTYGHIPNGNRSYYLSRSQPPFFSMMVELLASVKGDDVLKQFLPAMEKEYRYWMKGAETLKPGTAAGTVVKLKDGALLNRYWDESQQPRQESYREDVETAMKSKRNKVQVYQHLRAGAASGWDFSSRWFADNKTILSIETTDIIPVDLNSLLYNTEMILSRANMVAGNDSVSQQYAKQAQLRQQSIDRYCWNAELKFYTDYNFRKQKMTNSVTPAGLFPFCFFPHRQGYLSLMGSQAAIVVQEKLLKPGGLQSSEFNTGEQWDAPNGWAPLQWMAVMGLARSGQLGLAREIAQRWLLLNEKVYRETGKLMEKYNVADLSKPAGGGEYAAQDGFGWTNGVYLALKSWLK
ncbi:alpha,alpha-trehalase TreA [Flavihumibacter stibioxidans]|uniref:Alpha,alpha-trehalase n=1 Tax=Flavihumibacter stibioxidans TaxID=1834163 RepID=A0ABR7M819_9BACT|nr:alpha,alpha-trehalase TreA [Flavihumibacter stibioxidans]MBC6490870.1 alpha,alpha-trehalase [Flavihumibacter stibioxidans]